MVCCKKENQLIGVPLLSEVSQVHESVFVEKGEFRFTNPDKELIATERTWELSLNFKTRNSGERVNLEGF